MFQRHADPFAYSNCLSIRDCSSNESCYQIVQLQYPLACLERTGLMIDNMLPLSNPDPNALHFLSATDSANQHLTGLAARVLLQGVLAAYCP